MDINNALCSEIDRVADKLKSLGDIHEWIVDRNGHAYPYRGEMPDEFGYIVKHGKDGLLILKGGHEFIVDAISRFMIPAAASKLRKNTLSVAATKMLRSLELHIKQMEKIVGGKTCSDSKGMAMETQDVARLYEKYSEEFHSGLDLGKTLLSHELELIFRSGEQWVGCMRKLYESVCSERDGFYEEKSFWSRFHMEMCHIREFCRSKAFRFACDVLRKSGKYVTVATLDSLLSSSKYSELGRRLHDFYANMDFSGIYFPKSFSEFKDSVISATQAVSRDIGRQSRMARRLILVQMDSLARLIVDRICEYVSIEWLGCCEELLTCSMESMSSLVNSFDGEESEAMSLESSLFYEFRGGEHLAGFYSAFGDIKRILLFTWSFKKLGTLLPSLPGYSSGGMDYGEEYRSLLWELGSEVGDPDSGPVRKWMRKDLFDAKVRSGVSFGKQEEFVSDIFNITFERIHGMDPTTLEDDEEDTPALAILLGQEEAGRFVKLCKIMRMFSFFNSLEMFSRRTLANRMAIVKYLSSVVRTGPLFLQRDFFGRMSELLMARDMFMEVDGVLRLFFGGEWSGIVQLSGIRRAKRCVERQIDDEIREWCSSVLSDDFLEERAVRVERGADGARRLRASSGSPVLRRLDEYLMMMSLEDLMPLIPHAVHRKMSLVSGVRGIYKRVVSGCEAINTILEDVGDDLDLFYKEMDQVFMSIEKVLGLRWREVERASEVEELMDRVRELENRVYSYRFFVKKIAKEEMKTVFSSRIQKKEPFSLDSEAYVGFFRLYEKSIVIRGINRSMGRVLSQYLESVQEALEIEDGSFFVSRHRVRDGGLEKGRGCDAWENCFDPPLSEYFKILEKIFPSEEGYFFDEVLKRLDPGHEIKSRIEEIIRMVTVKYDFCLEVLGSVSISELPQGLYKRFIKVRSSYRSAEMFAKNTIPFFVFEHSMDTSQHQKLFEAVCDEVCRFVDTENSRVYGMLVAGKGRIYDGTEPRSRIEAGPICEEERGTEESALLDEISRTILVDEYLNSDEFRMLEELNSAVVEHGLKSPSTPVEMIINERNIVLEIGRRALDMFLSNIPFGAIKSRRESLDREIGAFNNEVDGIAREEDELMFYPMFKSLKAKHRMLEEKTEYLNKILSITGLPLISDTLRERIDTLDAEWDSFCRISESLKKYESQQVSGLDVAQFVSFLRSVDTGAFHAEYFRVFLCKIKHYTDACDYLWHVKSPYVKKKYFDADMELRQFFLMFNREDMEARLADSKIEYEVERYVEKTKAEVSSLKLELSSVGEGQVVVSNLGSIGDKVGRFLVEYDSISRLNTKGVFLDELGDTKRYIDECLDFVSCFEEVQKEIMELSNVFCADALRFEAKKYAVVKERFSGVLAGSDASESAGGKSIELAAILEHKDGIVEMKRGLNDVLKGLRIFLEKCREETPRLYLISDGDLIKALNNRSYYEEMLRMMFNIDAVITNNGSVAGFESCGERVMLRKEVLTDQSIGGFVDSFSNEARNTLRSYFYDGLEGIEEGCPSIISELITEFKYFNKKTCETTPKLRVLEREMEKYPNGVVRLYPKPVVEDGVLYMESIEKMEYGFEYYPPTDIVFTPLVCRVLSSIAVSLKSLCGAILYGRSGTGKTESVKYYCRLIGKPVFVFCCNEDCELATLRNVIEGAVLMGSYLCFDEFNRLSEETMSGATELILSSKDKTKFFLTMNIGYKGRYELPRSLRAIFGETRIDTPDVKDIIDYYCGGISEKIYRLMQQMESSTSRQDHYDFGLRAIRMIAGHGGEAEITRSMIYFFMACLLKKDKAVFVKEVRRIFGLDVEAVAYKDALLHGLDSRRGALVVGGNGVGKSVLIRAACDAREAACFYYNPRNMREIFGHRDELTGEWRDSRFVQDLRRNIHGGRECWFVFDGPVESSWIEDFNPILDENRFLCLSSGERIRIPEHYRFVFESTSMEKITPATLTRVFLVYMEEDRPSSACCSQDTSVLAGIRYDGQKTLEFPFKKLTATEEQSFYARSIETLSRDGGRVFFIRGEAGVGKGALISEVFGDDAVVIEGRGFEISMIEGSLGEDKIKKIGGGKVYDARCVIYIEEFDCTNVNLVEAVREYNEYGRMGELQMRNTVVICGVNERNGDDAVSGTPGERLERKVRSVFVEAPRDMPFLLEEEVRKRLGSTRHFKSSKKVLQVVLFVYKNFGASLRKITDFIRTLGDLCTEDGDLGDLMYFEAKIYFGECKSLRNEMQRIFGKQPDEIEFDLEARRFRKARECSDISCVGSILHRGYNLVVEGPRMSGKRWLVRECTRRMKIDVRIVGREDEKKIDGQTAFLVEDRLTLGKGLSSRCMTFKLRRRSYYSLDLLRVHGKIADGDTSHKDVLNECFVSEVGINIDSEGGGVFSEVPSLMVEVDEDGHPSSCLHPSIVTTGFLCKAIEFGMSFIRISKEFRDKEIRRRQFLTEGLQKIEDFREEACSLGSESSRKRKDLQDLTAVLNSQLEKIVTSQRQMEDEKKAIGGRKREMEEAFGLSQRRREAVDKRLGVAKALLEESGRGIKELSKSNLSEIKVMINPPEIVRSTVEAVFWLVEGRSKGDMGSIEWKQLIQFMKREDFVSKVLGCETLEIPDALEKLVSGPLFVHEKALNASKACGSLFLWVMARYKYAKIMLEISPMEQEIAALEHDTKKSRKEIEEEERKLMEIEDRIEAMKSEYNASVARLESIRAEIAMFDEKALMINKVICELSDEVEKWKRMKYLCPIRYMLMSSEWILDHNMSGFIHRSDVSRLLRTKRFVSTSLEDKNYRQVLSSCSYYGNDVIVHGCDRFDRDVYRALKHQMDNRTHSIILTSNSKTNPYKEYTYNCSFAEKFEVEDPGDLEKLEEGLLELIVGHAPLDEIYAHKKSLENERNVDRQYAKKREVYEVLNSLFSRKSKSFFEVYGVSLSFGIFKRYVEDVVYPILASRVCGDVKNMWTSMVDADMGTIQDIISGSIDSFYSSTYPETGCGYADLVDEIDRYPFDYTLVIACDDATYMVEEKMAVASVISAGPKENNEEIYRILGEKTQERKTHLIKNIHFLGNARKTGNNRLIFTIEEGKRHSLMEDSKVVYCRGYGAHETSSKALTSVPGGDPELVKFHMEMMCRSSQFGLKDLVLCAENMGHCDKEYLKAIVYSSRIDM
uniref:Dynein heavy chain n=1 Tax=Encephalitozoon cuniculi TaxID=6035 RepID=M1KAL2_ENCCN|nr:dynein heavy chain [Encephalitozoon cuniculi]